MPINVMTCLLCVTVLAFMGNVHAASVSPTDLIQIENGPIIGAWADNQEDVRVYKGVPYAAPPVGGLRWKAPQPVEPWQKPLACTTFAKGCVQLKNKLGFGGPKPEDQSEDCLYLNVWTAAEKGEHLPVMFYVHGGGFNTGSGSEPAYEGTALARSKVVVVTFNYRLNVLGFFAHPWLSEESDKNCSGNYGALDMIAALRWVKKNIKHFGGDPDNITVFGESAGAGGVQMLMTSPLSRDLFDKAILQSGVTTSIATPLRGEPESAEALGKKFVEHLGVKSLEELRAMDAAELSKAYQKTYKFVSFGEKFTTGPIIDGYVLEDIPLKVIRDGHTKHIRLMIGANADEGSIFIPHLPIKRPVGYKFLIKKMFPDDHEDVLRLFPVDQAQQLKPQYSRLLGVSMFLAPARLMARLHAEAGADTYLYHFTRVPPEAKRFGLGAMHGLEISYVFGTGKVLNTQTDKDLSRDMIQAWTSFAYNGVASLPNDLEWPEYTAKKDEYIEFGDTISVQSALEKEACDFFEERFIRKLGLVKNK